jgi:hypothetical protein
MPFFKTNYNIFTTPWEDELFDPNWMNSDKLVLPPNPSWDYSRELQIEDVDVWEQIYFSSGGLGLYAAWCPYAEFYLITNNLFNGKQPMIETFYGPEAREKAYYRGKELGMPLSLNKIWVEPEDMWIYKKENKQYS